ncbi:type 4a pilus biogenesis protein PilO [Malonomonas rubra]|uniref:type 4a pilus biogenesis protein PilO n=1 Tax=Malonomonas rubra TaxID=57040 RepID=UPI0026EC27E3|nr:type 4a pilus biogenesis protein PilO [Malonomonas rubra]
MLKNPLLKTIWEQSRVWVYVIGILASLSIVILFYQTQVVTLETEQLQHRQSSLQKQVLAREAKLSESGVPVSAVELMEDNLKQFSQLIPPKQKLSDFIGELFHWADEANLEIHQVSYQPKIDKETEYLNYGLSFSLQGTYKQLKKFMYLLENSKRILIVDKIGLTGKRNKDNSTSVNLQINLTTLFQEVPK